MKNYKKLTFKRSKNASNASYEELLNRLAELEDKIEDGTLIEVESPCTEEKFDYICKYYENGLCHLGEELFGVPPQLCDCINDFENCMGSKPIEYEKEQKIGITLKEIKQDAITQLVNLVNKKLNILCNNKHNTKLSAFYLSNMIKEALHELGYEVRIYENSNK
jgi:hypothetical protein